ncbi:MAG: alpha/beta hydrolase [Armatimonadota bacterium]|nr:alpha/beta hydrolase [Armatimonadota bacterium]
MAADDLGFIHRFISGRGGLTLLLLHGTGGSESDLIELGRALDPTAALLSPRGKVLENGMPRFFRRLAEGVFDEQDLIRRTHELADFVTAAAQYYGFDPRSVIAGGYSNGANIAGGLLLLRPEALSGAILLRPMVPLVPDTLPDLRETPVFISAGNYDPLVPVSNTERLVSLLGEAGADVTVVFEDAGHGLTSADVEAARDWLENRPA